MKFRSSLLVSSLAVAAMAFAAAASAACTHPTPPDKVPDGTKSSKEEMIAGMKAMRAYNDLVKQYTDCLRDEHDTAVAKIDPSWDDAKKTKAKDDLDKIMAQKNDAAVDEATAVTARFNEQIKVYNSAHKS
jgi:hypothetical protein